MINIGIHTGHKNIQDYKKAIEPVTEFRFTGAYLNTFVKDAVKRNNGIHFFIDFDELINKNDAIVFLNYDVSQYEYLIKAVKSSKHVFFESVNMLELSDARELMKLAAEANVLFKIGLKDSCFACINDIKSEFENPLLVESIIQKRKRKEHTQFNIIDQEIIDLIFQILSLINGNVKRVSAKSVSSLHPYEDVVNINLEFDNGSIVSFSANLLSKKESNVITLYKHEQYLRVDLLKKSILVKYQHGEKIVKRKLLRNNKAKINQLEDFRKAIEKGSVSLCSIEYGVKVLDVLQKIKEKMRITSNQM